MSGFCDENQFGGQLVLHFKLGGLLDREIILAIDQEHRTANIPIERIALRHCVRLVGNIKTMANPGNLDKAPLQLRLPHVLP